MMESSLPLPEPRAVSLARSPKPKLRKQQIGPARCVLESIGHRPGPTSSRPIASTATSYPQRHRQLKLLLHKQPRRHRQHMRHAPR